MNKLAQLSSMIIVCITLTACGNSVFSGAINAVGLGPNYVDELAAQAANANLQEDGIIAYRTMHLLEPRRSDWAASLDDTAFLTFNAGGDDIFLSREGSGFKFDAVPAGTYKYTGGLLQHSSVTVSGNQRITRNIRALLKPGSFRTADNDIIGLEFTVTPGQVLILGGLDIGVDRRTKRAWVEVVRPNENNYQAVQEAAMAQGLTVLDQPIRQSTISISETLGLSHDALDRLNALVSDQ